MMAGDNLLAVVNAEQASDSRDTAGQQRGALKLPQTLVERLSPQLLKYPLVYRTCSG